MSVLAFIREQLILCGASEGPPPPSRTSAPTKREKCCCSLGGRPSPRRPGEVISSQGRPCRQSPPSARCERLPPAAARAWGATSTERTGCSAGHCRDRACSVRRDSPVQNRSPRRAWASSSSPPSSFKISDSDAFGQTLAYSGPACQDEQLPGRGLYVPMQRGLGPRSGPPASISRGSLRQRREGGPGYESFNQDQCAAEHAQVHGAGRSTAVSTTSQPDRENTSTSSAPRPGLPAAALPTRPQAQRQNPLVKSGGSAAPSFIISEDGGSFFIGPEGGSFLVSHNGRSFLLSSEAGASFVLNGVDASSFYSSHGADGRSEAMHRVSSCKSPKAVRPVLSSVSAVPLRTQTSEPESQGACR